MRRRNLVCRLHLPVFFLLVMPLALGLRPVASHAQAPGLVPSPGQGTDIQGTLGASSWSVWAGVLATTGTPAHLFSLDAANSLAPGDSYVRNQDIAIEAEVVWLLKNYPPGVDLATSDLDGDGTLGDADDHKIEAAARQAAIWYFTDRFVITGPLSVQTRVSAILASKPPTLTEEYLLGQAQLVIVGPGYDVNPVAEPDYLITAWLGRGGQSLVDVDVTLSTDAGVFTAVDGVSLTTPAPTVTVNSGQVVTLTNNTGFATTANVVATVANQQLPAVWQHGSDPQGKQKLVSLDSGVLRASVVKRWAASGLFVLKFEDRNLNGVHDPDEPRLGGWNFTLKKDTALVASGTTGEATGVWYCGLDSKGSGTYTALEVAQSGWLNITPMSVEFDYTVGDQLLLPFGNAPGNIIEVVNYEDVNGNGEYDDGVDRILTGMPGQWHFKLYQVVNGQLRWRQTATARTDGIAAFSHVADGTYFVQEINTPGGWGPAESATKPGDVKPTPGWKSLGTVTGDRNTFYFGNIQLATISGYVWDDRNRDAIWDADEPGLDGWTIEVLDEGGTLAGTATTSSDSSGNPGYYQVSGLLPGSYTVREQVQVGWYPTVQLARGTDDADRADAEGALAEVQAAGDNTVTFGNALAAISVTKAASPTSLPEPGGLVTFTIEVYNPGLEGVSLIGLSDDVFGNVGDPNNLLLESTSCLIPRDIAAGGSYECQFSASIAGNASGSHTDTLTAAAVDGRSNSLSASDGEVVTITDVPSSIEVSKTPSLATIPEPGGDVTFTVTVENTSAADSITIESLVDDVYGDVTQLQGSTCSVPQSLLTGESYTCSFTGSVNGNAGDSETNTITAAGNDDDGGQVSGSGRASVALSDSLPVVGITRLVNPTSVYEPGGTVTYSIAVANGSAEPVILFTLEDDLHGDLHGQGDCEVPATIERAQRYECSFEATVRGNAGERVQGTATARAKDDEDNETSAQATSGVDVMNVPSSIEVSKTADRTAVLWPGEMVAFTIRVDNTSPVDTVTLTSLIDDLAGDVALLSGTTCSLPQEIGAGGFYQCAFSAKVAGEPGAEHRNVVQAAGTDDDGTPVSGSAQAAVSIQSVLVQLTPAEAVNYLDQGQTCAALTAQLLTGPDQALARAGVTLGFVLVGDNDASFQAAPGTGPVLAQTDENGRARATICARNPGTAAVTAWVDGDGDGIYAAGPPAAEPSDVATVGWLSGGLTAQKTASAIRVYAGDTVTYNYEVLNTLYLPLAELTGPEACQAPLSVMSVLDDRCTPVRPIEAGGLNAGDTDRDGRLDAEEVWLYICTTTLTADDTNTVAVRAEDSHGTVLTATDTATVDVISPGLAIHVSASATMAYSGDEVTFTYRVSNPGDDPLTRVSVSDDTCAPVAGPVKVAGNGDHRLDPGETWEYDCSAALDADSTSAATAVGVDSLGNAIAAAGGASVDVITPAITVTKTVDPDAARVGETVTFTVAVANLGDDPISELSLSDSMGLTLARTGGDTDKDGSLDPGETWSYTAAYTVTNDDNSIAPLINTARATGRDSLGGKVSDEDSASVAIESGTPSATVTLATWELTPGDEGVSHMWITGREVGVAGFHLYRGSREDRDGSAPLTELKAHGAGREYCYDDQGLALGEYYYWIAALDAAGEEIAAFGPESATVESAAPSSFSVFLPLTLNPQG